MKLIIEGSELDMYIDILKSLEKKSIELNEMKKDLRCSVVKSYLGTSVDVEKLANMLDKYNC